MMKEMIQQMMVYVVIVSALRSLLLNEKYEEYFRFFSGLIMILMLLTPILTVFGKPVEWFQVLEENILEMDVNEIKSNLKVSGENLEDKVLERYKKAIEKDIELMAKKHGISVEKISVTLKKKEDQVFISSVSCAVVPETGEREEIVETIQIGEGKENRRKEDTSEAAKQLKKTICEKLMLEGDQVHLWK